MAKRNEEAPKGTPAWMATFSDLMNLLLCFFVLLFSMSSVDAQKFEEVVASLQSSFSILSSGSSSIGEGQMIGSGISQLPELDVYFNEAMDSESDDAAETEENIQEQYEEAGLNASEQMAEEITEKLGDYGIADKVDVNFNSQYVRLTVSGALLFASGSADLNSDAKGLISKIGSIIEVYNENVIEIEGHTDNVPQVGGEFENNDVLSTYRALTVTDLIREGTNIDNAYLKFSGRGEYVPIAENTTSEGRAKNRRVEIKIYNKLYSDDKN